jgi:hypothetical protein
MAILLVFHNDAKCSEQTFMLERVYDRELVTNFQVFHNLPPPLQYDGERARRLKSETAFAWLAAACTPGYGTPDQLFYGLRL